MRTTRFRKVIVLTITMLCLGSIAFANNSNEIAVLYHGNSPVNMDTLHFMNQQFSSLGSGYRVIPIQNANDIQPGTFKAVVVLNSGLAAGIDRNLATFITAYPNKNEIILVSIIRGGTSLTIQYAPPSNATLGVDAISAASLWVGRGFFGGGNPEVYNMHVQWVKKVIALANRTK